MSRDFQNMFAAARELQTVIAATDHEPLDPLQETAWPDSLRHSNSE
ncbi:hypothetical protein ACFV0C_30275 [Streptomyces sp. NPDC059568]